MELDINYLCVLCILTGLLGYTKEYGDLGSFLMVLKHLLNTRKLFVCSEVSIGVARGGLRGLKPLHF